MIHQLSYDHGLMLPINDINMLPLWTNHGSQRRCQCCTALSQALRAAEVTAAHSTEAGRVHSGWSPGCATLRLVDCATVSDLLVLVADGCGGGSVCCCRSLLVAAEWLVLWSKAVHSKSASYSDGKGSVKWLVAELKNVFLEVGGTTIDEYTPILVCFLALKMRRWGGWQFVDHKCCQPRFFTVYQPALGEMLAACQLLVNDSLLQSCLIGHFQSLFTIIV